MIALHAPQHDAVRNKAKLAQRFFAQLIVMLLSDWVQELLVENRHVLKATMIAVLTLLGFVLGPMKLGAAAFLAKVAGERLDLEKPKKRKEFADSILDRCSRQTPLVVCMERETSLGNSSRASLDIVGFVKDQAVVMYGVDLAVLLDETIFTLPALGLLAVD